MSLRHWHLPLFFTGLLLCGAAHHFPSPVWDGATLVWVQGFHLQFPIFHLIFTPFCSFADFLTTLSAHQAEVFVVWVIVLSLLFGGLRKGFGLIVAFIFFVAWGALIPRPMGKLIAENPDVLLIDFHSHTSYSHDGRPSFTPEANRKWHELQGFNAGFITDHNRVEGTEEAHLASIRDWNESHYRSLEGEEISLAKTHLVLLGNAARVDNHPYDSDPKKIGIFVSDMHQRHLPVIASLPEYWLYHWGEGVQDFERYGMDGFEIINSAPKALDFPLADRQWIVSDCRRMKLVMTGITDNHGYGYATATWNAMHLPGWQSWSPDKMQTEIISRLTDHTIDRSTLVQVLERPRFFADTPAYLAISPLINFWIYLQELTFIQVGVWMLWIWCIALFHCAFFFDGHYGSSV